MCCGCRSRPSTPATAGRRSRSSGRTGTPSRPARSRPASRATTTWRSPAGSTSATRSWSRRPAVAGPASRHRARGEGAREMPAVDTEFPVLLLNDLHKVYNPGSPLQVHVLKGVSLAVARGDYVAIMGHSGSGKSTMLNILGCLDLPTDGSYLIDGVDVRSLTEGQLADVRNQYLGFVFQTFNLVRRTTAMA